jgi:hypothetical protein
MDSQASQHLSKLRQVSSDTAKAWEWIERNQDLFQAKVHGPPLIECSVKDPRYLNAIESIFSQSDITSITTQTRQDFLKVQDHLYGTMKLHDVNLRQVSEDSVSRYRDRARPPVSEQQMLCYRG